MTVYSHEFDTELGRMIAFFDEEGSLTALNFKDGKGVGRALRRLNLDLSEMEPAPFVGKPLEIQVLEYFAGERKHFDVTLNPEGSTFQKGVWRLLQAIPYGRVASYGEIARKLGNPGASRGVGAANGANPISIIVPCHRVIGSNGTLTGYAAGIERKKWLLELEGYLPVQGELWDE